MRNRVQEHCGQSKGNNAAGTRTQPGYNIIACYLELELKAIDGGDNGNFGFLVSCGWRWPEDAGTARGRGPSSIKAKASQKQTEPSRPAPSDPSHCPPNFPAPRISTWNYQNLPANASIPQMILRHVNLKVTSTAFCLRCGSLPMVWNALQSPHHWHLHRSMDDDPVVL